MPVSLGDTVIDVGPVVPDRTHIAISEMFSPTIQGEGPSMGRICGFVRTAGCNLGCHWCDSAYTWRFTSAQKHNVPVVYDRTQEVKKLTVWDVVQEILGWDVPRVILTGGEPALQQAALARVIHYVRQTAPYVKFEMETAGTIIPSHLLGRVNQFNVSPKLENSGNPFDLRYRPEVLHWFAAQGMDAIFKFVCAHPTDFDEIDHLVQEHGIYPGRVWIMPEGVDAQVLNERLQVIAPEAIRRGYNVSTRLHIQIFGNRRGV